MSWSTCRYRSSIEEMSLVNRPIGTAPICYDGEKKLRMANVRNGAKFLASGRRGAAHRNQCLMQNVNNARKPIQPGTALEMRKPPEKAQRSHRRCDISLRPGGREL